MCFASWLTLIAWPWRVTGASVVEWKSPLLHVVLLAWFALLLVCFKKFKLFCRESESGLINCCVNGLRELLPFDTNSFELRGAAQFGDLVTNSILFLPSEPGGHFQNLKDTFSFKLSFHWPI